MSNYKIIINKNGEPRLVEVSEKPSSICGGKLNPAFAPHGDTEGNLWYRCEKCNYFDGYFKVTEVCPKEISSEELDERLEAYEQALSTALADEKNHIAFKDQRQTVRLVLKLDYINKKDTREWLEKNKGHTFDLPIGVEVILMHKCFVCGAFDDEICGKEEGGCDATPDMKVAVLYSPPESEPSSKQGEKENLYNQLKNWLVDEMYHANWSQHITKDDGQYFAINDTKRFVGFNHDLKFGKTWFGIREDGDTRTVFNGIVETLEDAKRIWDLTDPYYKPLK